MFFWIPDPFHKKIIMQHPTIHTFYINKIQLGISTNFLSGAHTTPNSLIVSQYM